MKKIVLLCLFTLCFQLVHGQRGLWTMNYRVSLPAGEMNDFISSTSWRGFAGEGRALVTENLAIGGHVAWTVFNEKVTGDLKSISGTIEGGDGDGTDFAADVGGTQFRYTNLMPMLFTAHYYLGDEYGIRPYLGVGVGTYHSWQRTDLGSIRVQQNSWHFGYAPEIGLHMPLGGIDTAIMLSARYDYALSTNNAMSYSAISLNVGITFIQW